MRGENEQNRFEKVAGLRSESCIPPVLIFVRYLMFKTDVLFSSTMLATLGCYFRL